jgi:thiamine biosynthesis protein ThiS
VAALTLPSSIVKIDVNNTPMDLQGPLTVADLLDVIGKAKTPCAVERNGTLIPWRTRSDVQVESGDSIEIVTLVGGG